MDECSLRQCRVPHVLLEPPVLPGGLCRRDADTLGPLHVRHDGAHCRVVRRHRPGVRGGRRHVRLDAHRARHRRQHVRHLLVRSQAFRRGLRQREKLHAHVAQTRLQTDGRTARLYAAADTITRARSFAPFSLWNVIFCLIFSDVCS